MNITPDFARGFCRGLANVATVRPWLVFMAGVAVGALLIAARQPGDAAVQRPPMAAASTVTSQTPNRPAMPHAELAATFAEAAESLRTGRHAEAYGRFVTLADEGDTNAARIALVMYRFGPAVFGSDWDASVEQIINWTRRSEAAAKRELEHLRLRATGGG